MWDRIKSVLPIVLVVIVVALGYQYWSSWKDSQAEIVRVTKERDVFLAKNEALEQQVTRLTDQQNQLDRDIATRDSNITSLNREIDKLRTELDNANNSVLVETGVDAIFRDFREAYGLTGDNVKKITLKETAPSGFVATNSFLAVPVDLSKNMVVAKNEADTCKEVDTLQEEITTLRVKNRALTEQKFQLEVEKSMAYAEGHREATELYMKMTETYVDLLEKPPKIQLGPRWLQLATGFFGGIATCGL